METSKEFLSSMKKAKQSIYLQTVALFAVVVSIVTLSASFIY